MKKLSLAVIGLYVLLLGAHSQSQTDTSSYKSRKLSLSEINFVSGYYHQNGDHSPITGGTGTEKLTDLPNSFEIKLSKYTNNNIKHEVNIEIGLDHFTSASTNKINPYPHSLSSASSKDTRFYPSLAYKISDEKKGVALSLFGSYSLESTYRSKGGGFELTKISFDKNTEATIKFQTYLDKVSVILPVELRTVRPYLSAKAEPRVERNSYSSSLTVSQIINTRIQIALLLDLACQKGLLSTPYHRIYFINGGEGVEKLPASRFKTPVGLRIHYFLGDKFIIRTYYRFYHDDWGLTAQTFNLEVPVKLNSFISISPFFRYYSQNGLKYYAPFKHHDSAEDYYTTDDDLSNFKSDFEGAGVTFTPASGIFGIKHFTKAAFRYGHYHRTDALHADIITLALNFK